jgi:hypothetical protein
MVVQKVYAQAGQLRNTVTNISGIGSGKGLPQYFNMAINLVMGFGVGISVIFLILGGIQYIMSKGDAKAAEAARQWLTNAVIGMIIVVAVFALRTMVFSLIGFGNVDSNVDSAVISF